MPAVVRFPAGGDAVKNPFLIGQKVYLRPLEQDDAPQFVAWMNDSDVWSNLMIYRPINLRQETEFLERVGENDNEVVLGIALRESDQLIGGTGLNRIDWKN